MADPLSMTRRQFVASAHPAAVGWVTRNDKEPVCGTMQRVALCLPVTADGLVLLGLKKRGFGQGKLVGLGGKVEPGEDPAAAAARELREEAGLLADIDCLEAVARLTFLFPTRPDWDHHMHVFLVRAWRGEPLEGDEIQPQWHPIDALPFDRMWDDSRTWLPQVLAGQRLAAIFVYGEDQETVVHVEQSDADERRLAQI